MDYCEDNLHIEWSRIKQLSAENKKELLPFIQFLIDIATKCRQEGIAPLQREEKEQTNPCLILAFKLIADGRMPDILQLVLGNLIYSTEQSDMEYIQRILIYQWARTLQKGLPIQEIKYILCSYIGIEYLPEIEEM